MNLLLANGHPDAWEYPLGMIGDECRLVVERLNSITVAHALAFRTAYISARVEKGDEIMGDFIEHLTGE